MDIKKSVESIIFTLRKTFTFGQKSQIEYLLELGTWLHDGVKPLDALTGMRKILLMSKKENTIIFAATESMILAIQGGKPINEGMDGYFDKYLVTIFKSAEQSGTLNQALQMIKDDAEQLKILKIVFYKPVVPTFIYLMIMIAGGINIHLNTLPQLARGKDFNDWPSAAQDFSIMMGMMITYWPIIISVLVIFSYMGVRYLNNNTSQFRMDMDTMPIFNLYRTYVGNNYLKMLSVLLKSHMRLIDALRLIEINSTPYIAWHAKQAQKKIDHGEKELGKAINTGIIKGDVMVKMEYLTSTSSTEGKINGLRVTAERSINMATKQMQKAGLITAVSIGVLLVYLLIITTTAMLTMTVAR
jgi:type II secretory pathway component PulF